MSKVEALRWLVANVGKQIETVQRRDDRVTWRPGPRTLGRKGNLFTLDGSTVRITPHHKARVEDGSIVLEWFDEQGYLIHTTVYSNVGEDK